MAYTARMTNIALWDPAALLQSVPFQPLHECIRALDTPQFPTLAQCNALFEQRQPRILTRSGQVVRLAAQEYGKLPFERQYEPRCYLSGEVPTREQNWHDLLNALVWLAFPQAKAAINARHYRSLTADGAADINSQRGAVRDMNTLFDESGVVVAYADENLAQLLRDFKWKELFWQQRAAVQRSLGCYLFGHGLYEKALQPYVGMTGQGLLLKVEQAFFDWPLERRLAHLDGLIATYLDDPQHCRDTHELSPVPLLGMPGWWADNEQESFYDNTAYFRPGRQSRAQRTPLNTAPSSVAG